MFAEPGIFVCVVGPSGAGKDTLLRLARSELALEARFVFPLRSITRPPSPHEDHVVLSEAAYDEGVSAGRFALAWRAHGLGYAIEAEVLAALAAGRIVTCNVSREAIAPARRSFPRVVTLLVTAPAPALAARLAGRGRETVEAISARLARNDEFDKDFAADFRIDNSAAATVGAQALTGILRGLAVASPLARTTL